MRAWLLLLTGCSSVLGIDDLEGPVQLDASSSDGPPGQTFRITGAVTQLDGSLGNNSVPAAIVSLVDAPGVDAITDENGTFELIVPATRTARALDARAPGFRPTRLFFPEPVTTDFETQVQLIEMSLLQMFGLLCGPAFDESKPVILAFVLDDQGRAIVGAPIASTPTAKWCGTDGVMIMPDQTGFGGFAFEFELSAGPVEVHSGILSGTMVDAPPFTNVVLSVDGIGSP